METETPEFAQSPYPEKPTGLVLTHEAQYYLAEAGKWTNFLGIIGFIGCGLFLILALCIGTVFSMLARMSPASNNMPTGVFPILSGFLILIDVLYFFFPFYLYQFGSRIKKGLAMMDSDQIAEAIVKLKSFFKLCGIVTIIVLCLYALEIIGIALIGTSLRH